jgi:hypothetical protein
VLDAPNIAYFGQNFEKGGFRFRQIEIVLKALRAEGKRVFMTMPHKYTLDRIPNHARNRGRPGRSHTALSRHEAALLEVRGWGGALAGTPKWSILGSEHSGSNFM